MPFRIKPEKPLLGARFTWPATDDIPLSERARQAKNTVEKKLEKGIYAIEDAPCFCGGREDQVLATRDRHGFYYRLVACRRCGLLRANPRMTQSSYALFYRDEYRAAYGENEDDVATYFESTLKTGREVYLKIRSAQPKGYAPKVVFETGCNMGAMLLPWKEDGAQVYGADFNVRRIEEGNRRLNTQTLFCGGTDKLIGTGVKADLIILHHVFEHFLDLKKEMEVLRSLLASDGHIAVLVPGTLWWIKHICGSNIMGLLQNAHTYQFSLASLRYVMESGGFSLAYGNEEIFSLFCPEKFERASGPPAGEYERVIRHLRALESRFALKRTVKRIVRGALGLPMAS